MERIYVICFYWEGDRWRTTNDFTQPTDLSYQKYLRRAGETDKTLVAQYVNNLYKGVERFATQDFDFVCFTNENLKVDRNVEIRRFPLHTGIGVLPRVYMFSQEANLLNRQVLCLDLDVLIVGSLHPLMDYEGMFCARSKFQPGQEHKLDGDVMSFRAGQETEERFWKPFIKDVSAAEKLTQGRERYWMRHVAEDVADRWDKVAPGAVLSYKQHVKRLRLKQPPERTSIISFHGHPRIHQAQDQWIKQYWG
jgi:hypothetical protein